MVEIYEDSIVIVMEKRVYHIKIKDIVCIEVHDRKTLMLTTEDAIIVNKKLGYFKEQFKECTFSQPHSSYLVNLEYVSYFDDKLVKLRYGLQTYEVYMSQRRYKSFKQDFLVFMENKQNHKLELEEIL